MNTRWIGVFVCCALALAFSGCPKEPELNVSVTSLHFGTTEDTENPGQLVYETQKQFVVQNTGCKGTTLTFTVSADKPWINVEPTAGQSTGEDDPVTVTVTIDRDYPENEKANLNFASGVVTVQASIGTATVAVTTAPDYFTQTFTGSEDLQGKTLAFAPNGGLSYYGLTVADVVKDPNSEDPANIFPTDPTNGLLLSFNDLGDPIQAGLLGGRKVNFYGVEYSTLFISSQGWISFGAAGNGSDTLTDHFSVPQIAAFPLDATQEGSEVTYLQDAQKLIITYKNAPTLGSNPPAPNDVQVELFFNGDIHISYPNIDPTFTGVIGLSVGAAAAGEIPQDFIESDLNTNPLDTE